ncbi:MAG: hypothetical protein WCG34_11785, partial [Leptolinea sp.]
DPEGHYGIKQEVGTHKGTTYLLMFDCRDRANVAPSRSNFNVLIGTEVKCKISFTDSTSSDPLTKYIAPGDWTTVVVPFTASNPTTWLSLVPDIPDRCQDDKTGCLVDNVKLARVDLDVNGDGDLTDSFDGLLTYLPGYKGNDAMLNSGDSYKNREYSGPQAMRIILPGIGTDNVDSVTFKIINPTAWFGYCSNAIASTAVNWGNDFSFSSNSDLSEISGTIESGMIWTPIYCKDYGAWCEVEITLKKNGESITPQPIILTLPNDTNGDKIADLWQDQQINAWNGQFGTSRPHTDAERDKMKPNATTNKYPDDEDEDSDGPSGRLPAMADAGDGLSVLEEYRGFILDGGPNTTSGQHKRLSTARKELLVECIKEINLTDTSKNGEGTNQNALSSFTVSETMADVSLFYSNKKTGAEIDLYWVETDLLQPGDTVVYLEDGEEDELYEDRNIWEWNGDLIYNSINTQLLTGGNAGIPVIDQVWKKIAPDYHNLAYGINRTEIFHVNRGAELEAFVKLLLPTRYGYIKGGLLNDEIDLSVARYFSNEKWSWHQPMYEYYEQGAMVPVAALADEGIYYYGAFNRHYTQNEFSLIVKWSIAHELGHMITRPEENPTGEFSLMSGIGPVGLDCTVRGLPACQWHYDEIKIINLPERKSINPSR